MDARRLGPWLVLVAALAIGILAGREIAAERSRSFLGGIFVVLLLAVGIVALGAAAVVGVFLHGGRLGIVTKSLVAAAGLLVVGTVGGHLTAGLTGAIDRAPVVLESVGTSTIDLTGAVESFAPRDNSAAVCRSVPDEQAVGDVYESDLGELSGATLRGTLTASSTSSDVGSLELWIDGGDLSDGADQPFWGGPVTIQAGRDGFAGVATFSRLGRESGPAKGDVTGTPTPTPTDGWPATMSGQLSWTCAAW
jgi:hypothetical protein